MQQYQANSTEWPGRSVRQGSSTELWAGLANFACRQPELVFAGALIGGALLAYWAKNAMGSADSPAKRWVTSSAQSFTTAGRQSPNPREHRTWAADNAGSRRMPSARLGATEDQMESLATPSAQALETGTAGATGTAYDLDPKSITGG